MTVNEFMAKSGCEMTCRGYEYLAIALEVAVKNPEMSLGMIVTNTAKKKSRTYGAVQKGLERVIENGYPNMDADIKRIVFEDSKRVTVGKYIVAVSYAIRNSLI